MRNNKCQNLIGIISVIADKAKEVIININSKYREILKFITFSIK